MCRTGCMPGRKLLRQRLHNPLDMKPPRPVAQGHAPFAGTCGSLLTSPKTLRSPPQTGVAPCYKRPADCVNGNSRSWGRGTPVGARLIEYNPSPRVLCVNREGGVGTVFTSFLNCRHECLLH